MGMNLQAVMEPLLTKLWQAADDMYVGQAIYDPTNPGEVAKVEEGRKYLHSDLSSLIARFRGYYSLDGHDLDPVADQFAGQSDRWEAPTGSSVYSSVARAAGDVDDVAKLIHTEQWQGKAAMAFHDRFLVPFKTTAVTHCECAREMAIGAKALAGGVERAKECVVWVCKDAISRLGGGGDPGSLPGEEGEGGTKHAAGFAAILADAVALFLALTGPEGDLLDAALAATGVGGGLIAESNTPSHERPISVNSSLSAMSLVHNTWTALTNLDANIFEFDEKIGKGLDTDFDDSGPFGSPFARIDNPDLKSSAYHRLTFRGPAHAATDADDGVITSIVRLYYAGYRTLPAAAEQYEDGAKICAGAYIDGVQAQFPQAVRKFNEGAQTFGRLLGAVGDDLTRSGKSIVSAATDYESTDEYEASEIRKLENQIPPPGDSAGAQHYDPPPWLSP
ncbi:hypothetical protein [Rugosimonospora africana]|uniref:Uncharacterized protein n=1 Tax=Rugosimonospora africana TaxID=556532 RepID=A0A8J3VS33_9ACTN|nr:hypothetical protein [Rugosimonospora africana]GIH16033.1 hypothetical protein Raf01_42050 [Rugosimonospora africana]